MPQTLLTYTAIVKDLDYKCFFFNTSDYLPDNLPIDCFRYLTPSMKFSRTSFPIHRAFLFQTKNSSINMETSDDAEKILFLFIVAKIPQNVFDRLMKFDWPQVL